MSESKRFVVLEVNDQSQTLYDYIEYLTLSQPGVGFKAITRREACNVMYYLVRDLVDGLLAHRAGDDANTNSMAMILFGAQKLTAGHQKHFKEFETCAIWSGIKFNLLKQIEATIKPGSWTEWNVVKSGDLIGIAEGEDYRITEFHREENVQRADDEAIITLNCLNPINYIYRQFTNRYGTNIDQLRAALAHPASRVDNLQRQFINEFFEHPETYIVGLFLDTLIMMHPQIELTNLNRDNNRLINKLLGIYDISLFQRNVVSRVIMAFGLNWFNHEVKPDQSYTVEYYINSHVLALFTKSYTSHTAKYEAELLNAFKRQDFLPEKERQIAERLYIESYQGNLTMAV